MLELEDQRKLVYIQFAYIDLVCCSCIVVYACLSIACFVHFVR
jgi:hypothetical protein